MVTSFTEWQRQRDYNYGFREAQKTQGGDVSVSPWKDGARKNIVAFTWYVWQGLMLVIAKIVTDWLMRHMS